MSNDLFDVFQSAYRPYHSCETALVAIHNDIETMLDSKLNIALLTFDLSTAFDTVNHQICLTNCIFITVSEIMFWHGLTHICQVGIIM